MFRAAAPDGAAPPPWQVRTIDDLLFTAPDLATLHSWVTEGRLHPDDCVSRSGRHFVKLGEMPEFAEAFAGFVGLPGVLETEAERGTSEQSALDVLGPPPVFGTHASDDDSAALTGVPEPTGMDHSAMLERAVDLTGSSSSFALDDAVVARPHDSGGPLPAAQPPPPPPPRPAARHPTPVPGTMTPRTRAPTAPPNARATDARGVPAHVPEDRSSSRPLSMLDVVTHHVRPIAQPVIESTREADSAPVAAAREAAREVMPQTHSGPVVLAEHESKRSGWKLWAALGILAGGAVVFGIPQIRERVLGAPAKPVVVEATAPPKATDDTKLLDDAAAAIASGDPQALARAEASLAAAAGTRDKAQTSALRVTAAEVLATRAVVHELWGAVEPAMRSDARFWAQEDAARAFALLAELDGAEPSSAPAIARANALLRVVQGKGDATGLAIDEETALVVAVAPLLRDPTGKLPDAVRSRLAELATPSVLARVVLALGHVRAGDAAAAKKVIDGVLAESPGQPVARALGRATATPSGKPTPDSGDDPVVVADTGDTAGTPPVEPAVPTESASSLIDRGCRKAEAGDGEAAVALLKKALEKRPNDTDALLCMGDANSKIGAWEVALKHYERALGRAPQMMSALQGAGKAAAKLGRTGKAMKFYERLLEQDPSHAPARAFVDSHKNDAPDETDNG